MCTHTRRMLREDWSYAATDKQLPEAGSEAGSILPWHLQREHGPACRADFGLVGFSTISPHISAMLTHPVCGRFYSGPRKLVQSSSILSWRSSLLLPERV